jgi:phosphoheptose isomerase
MLWVDIEAASKISSEQVSKAVSLLIEVYKERKKVLVIGAGRITPPRTPGIRFF